MIQTTRLNGSHLVVNADLIEVIEATPDTVITLIDGTRFIVVESPDELIRRIQLFRAGVLRLRDDPELSSSHSGGDRSLSVVPNEGARRDDGRTIKREGR
ncbi:MAG: flagellar FlbD family protein [Acidimicrobiales bacterium]